MGKRYEKLSQKDKEFIAHQHLFLLQVPVTAVRSTLVLGVMIFFRIIGDNEAVATLHYLSLMRL